MQNIQQTNEEKRKKFLVVKRMERNRDWKLKIGEKGELALAARKKEGSGKKQSRERERERGCGRKSSEEG